MKKFVLLLISMIACVNAYAFKFDGIDLNGSVGEVTRAISLKHYVAATDRPNALTGLCQGTKIYLAFNLDDVTTKGKVGQLIVDVPNSDKSSFVNNAQLLNVIYHQVSSSESGFLYQVDEDGTTLLLSQTENGYRLTYSTPYYKAAK